MSKEYPTSQNQQRKWTVMVYMVGDDDLADNCIDDMKEMKSADVGPDKPVTVVVQYDRGGKDGTTKRFIINRISNQDDDGQLHLDEEPTDREGMDANMGDPAVLKKFILWSHKKFPADHYMLVLWGHGNGVDDDFRTEGGVVQVKARSRALFRHDFKSISMQESRQDFQDFLDNQELKDALLEVTSGICAENGGKNGGRQASRASQPAENIGRKFDVLGLDACLMNMVEICCQVKDSVNFLVASEGLVPLYSWPYHRILTDLANQADTITPPELSSGIVDRFINSYKDYDDRSVTHAACNLSVFGDLRGVSDRLAATLTDAIAQNAQVKMAVMLARSQAQSYSDAEEFIDFYDFCYLLEHYCADAQVKLGCVAVMQALDEGRGIIIKNGVAGPDLPNSHGLSIYFPRETLSRTYGKLDFAKDTEQGSKLESKWMIFIKKYLDVAQRPSPVQAQARSSRRRGRGTCLPTARRRSHLVEASRQFAQETSNKAE